MGSGERVDALAVARERRYTLREAAETVGVCYATVWRAVKSGELRAGRRGTSGHYTVTESDLRSWAFGEE